MGQVVQWSYRAKMLGPDGKLIALAKDLRIQRLLDLPGEHIPDDLVGGAWGPRPIQDRAQTSGPRGILCEQVPAFPCKRPLHGIFLEHGHTNRDGVVCRRR